MVEATGLTPGKRWLGEVPRRGSPHLHCPHEIACAFTSGNAISSGLETGSSTIALGAADTRGLKVLPKPFRRKFYGGQSAKSKCATDTPHRNLARTCKVAILLHRSPGRLTPSDL
jgi:hypothetical protein